MKSFINTQAWNGWRSRVMEQLVPDSSGKWHLLYKMWAEFSTYMRKCTVDHDCCYAWYAQLWRCRRPKCYDIFFLVLSNWLCHIVKRFKRFCYCFVYTTCSIWRHLTNMLIICRIVGKWTTFGVMLCHCGWYFILRANIVHQEWLCKIKPSYSFCWQEPLRKPCKPDRFLVTMGCTLEGTDNSLSTVWLRLLTLKVR